MGILFGFGCIIAIGAACFAAMVAGVAGAMAGIIWLVSLL